MRFMRILSTSFAAIAGLLAGIGPARAEPVKIGLILPYSGPFAEYGQQIDNGAQLALQQAAGGRKIELIRRDSTGPAPDIARRLAQELVVRAKVDLLAGFGFTPNALAAAAIASEAKTPMVVMNAASSVITTKSPYIVRFSFTLPQVSEPFGGWAAKNGVKSIYTLVSDYAPGHDAETAFKKGFVAAGGQVTGGVRVPLKSPEFSAYIQKIKDVKPDAVFAFVPSGEQGAALVKTWHDLGLNAAGIKLLATGDLTDDGMIETLGDGAIGMITSHHYSRAHDSPANAAFIAAYEAAYPGIRPNFMAVAGYDGMRAIIAALQDQPGALDPEKTLARLAATRLESPRGPISIDPATRDIVQSVYIRRVERINGRLVNLEFDRFEQVKDPGK